MASMTVRDIDEDIKRRFVEKARAAGRSAEGHLRALIAREATEAVADEATESPEAFLERIRGLASGISEQSRREMEEGMREARYAYDAEIGD